MRRLILITAALAATSALAMPPRPGLREPEALIRARAEGRIDNPAQGLLQRQVAKGGPAKISGSFKYPVVLGYFTDQANTNSQSDFQDMLFGTGAGVKSVNNYYRDMSFGSMSCTGAVDAWRSSGNTVAYYGNNNNGLTDGTTRNVYEFIRRVLTRADSTFNFADTMYDRNHDGYVDVLWVVHSGKGAEETRTANDIWSHSADLDLSYTGGTYYTTNDISSYTGTAVRISKYIIMPERTNYASGSPYPESIIGCGVFCHEFGHALGLPDLYDTGPSPYEGGVGGEGLGNWSLMAGGSWGGNGNSNGRPVALDLWCRRFLGWCVPQLVTVNGPYTVNSTLATATSSSFKLAKQGQDTTRQYWLVENRHRLTAGSSSGVRWDSLLAGQGLLVYHVDTMYTSGSYLANNQVNRNSTNGSAANRPYGVAVEETDITTAGYGAELWTSDTLVSNRGDAADAWSSSTQSSFDSTGASYPVSQLNGATPTSGGASTGISITGIPAASAAMTCNLNVFPAAPDLSIGLFQNPAFTYSLGISMVTNFAVLTPANLDTANLTIGTGTPQRLSFAQVSMRTFQETYMLQAAGNYLVRVATRDSGSTMRTGERAFSVVAAKTAGGAAAALDGAVRLSFTAGAVPGDELWVVCRSEANNDDAFPAGPAYQVGPQGRALAAPAVLTLRYDAAALAGRDPARLAVCEYGAGGWRRIDSAIDAAAGTVSAPIATGGVYQVCWSESFPQATPAPAAPRSASPNPFDRATTIRYQLGAAERVSLAVYNVAGQLVRTLVDGRQLAGPQAAVWDGADDGGRRLPSGVYHYRLRIGDRSSTGRIVKVQ
jgi:M6 family metalloprotease-like protein